MQLCFGSLLLLLFFFLLRDPRSSMADLHIFLFPFLVQGHIIPMVDIARLFAARGVKTTVLTTAAYVSLIQPTLDLALADASLRHPIRLLPLRLPSSSDAGISQDRHNLTAHDTAAIFQFASALAELEGPLSQLLRDHRPDCIVSDIFYPWVPLRAKELGIPLLAFHGTSFFSSVVVGALGSCKLDEDSAEQVLELPGLPHLSLSKIPESITKPSEFMKSMAESGRESYGVIMNSFYELEQDFIDHSRRSGDIKAWFVGPVSLHSRRMDEKTVRGNRAYVSSDRCLKWLDTKKPRSVLYVCFGSLGRFTAPQLREIARGLEESDRPFIWVVQHASEPAEWLPEGFEGRVIGKGLIVRGWAPQLLILNHEAVGGFVTHCGWNSSLEAVTAGMPVITWPLFGEQFFNEKLLVEVQKIGVAVGATARPAEEKLLVSAGQIKKAVDELMGNGEEQEKRRKKAKELGELAKKAVEGGGSSHVEMSHLIEELIKMRKERELWTTV